MKKVSMCKKCNKKILANLEEKFEANNIEYNYCCIKSCGNRLTVKTNGLKLEGKTIDDLVEKIINS